MFKLNKVLLITPLLCFSFYSKAQFERNSTYNFFHSAIARVFKLELKTGSSPDTSFYLDINLEIEVKNLNNKMLNNGYDQRFKESKLKFWMAILEKFLDSNANNFFLRGKKYVSDTSEGISSIFVEETNRNGDIRTKDYYIESQAEIDGTQLSLTIFYKESLDQTYKSFTMNFYQEEV